MQLKSFEDLFVEELKDIYDAEKRITKALPKLARKASSEELTSALEEHLEITQGQIHRLDQIFEQLGKTPGRKMCEGMAGLLAEGDSMIEETDGEDAMTDAAIIAAAQKVEHYEIASYGTLREWARRLGHDEVAESLQETLNEEGEADKTLSRIASALNIEAAEGNGDGMTGMDDGSEDEGEMAETGRTGAKAGASRGRTSQTRARKR